MKTTVCPKCGFRQEVGAIECRCCGIIFERYRPSSRPTGDEKAPLAVSARSPLRRILSALRWVALAFSLTILALILHQSPPPRVQVAPDAAPRAKAKVQDFQSATSRGRPATLHMDEAELNAWAGSNLASMPAEPPIRPVAPGGSDSLPSVEAVQTNVRDVKLQIQGDQIGVYVVFNLYGKDLSLMLEGHLEVKDGYLRLIPTAGKLGSLPLTEATLRSAADRLFDSAENREKFRLPEEIRDIRIEGGELIVTAK